MDTTTKTDNNLRGIGETGSVIIMQTLKQLKTP
jgi:hypothetical protein